MQGDRDLMRLHVETCFTHDAHGRMRRANEPEGATTPRFFLGRTAEGNEWRVRDDLGSDLVRTLRSLSEAERVSQDLALRPDGADEFSHVLAEDAPIRSVWTGPTYHFRAEVSAGADTVLVTEKDAEVLRPHFAEWLEDPPQCQPFLALLRDGVAVSICCSVRIGPEAHEAGVETSADSRGRGYAARAVGAWASAVRQIGRVPLYSTSWENTASQAVARKLGLVQFGATLHIT